MAEVLPSYDLIARRVDAEHDAHIRHADALDSKGRNRARLRRRCRGDQLVACDSGASPWAGARDTRRYGCARCDRSAPVSDLGTDGSPKYLRADPELTQLVVLDTTILMIQQLKSTLERKSKTLKFAVVVLTLAIVLSGAGTLF